MSFVPLTSSKDRAPTMRQWWEGRRRSGGTGRAFIFLLRAASALLCSCLPSGGLAVEEGAPAGARPRPPGPEPRLLGSSPWALQASEEAPQAAAL